MCRVAPSVADGMKVEQPTRPETEVQSGSGVIVLKLYTLYTAVREMRGEARTEDLDWSQGCPCRVRVGSWRVF